jgi:hypothetical protein
MNYVDMEGRWFVSSLRTLPVSSIYRFDHRMINEYEVTGGMRVGRGNSITRG